MKTFVIASTPRLHFGAGKISVLPAVVKNLGTKILLVTGANSFMISAQGKKTMEHMLSQNVSVEHCTIDREPTPAMIDAIVKEFSETRMDVVVAIGGGSALDAGKAIAAMLPLKDSVKNYLEGVGTKLHPGKKTPFIAVPTTSGTGSEATKNAVLSETGEHGYKKSLRHDNFVPEVAIIDPVLTIGCPASTTAASGMDAFTQLLESYLSTTANPVTDALAIEGLRHVSKSLRYAYHDGSDIHARSGMSLAAYLSGITLANAGLGVVHGFASSVGGYFEIPHGVICSSMMAAANKITVRKLREEGSNEEALTKYWTVGRIFSGIGNRSNDYYTDFLLDVIETWTAEMSIPRLSQYGLTTGDFEKIVHATDNKNNPAKLNREEMLEVLAMAL